jgi:hypothetical protein
MLGHTASAHRQRHHGKQQHDATFQALLTSFRFDAKKPEEPITDCDEDGRVTEPNSCMDCDQ